MTATVIASEALFSVMQRRMLTAWSHRCRRSSRQPVARGRSASSSHSADSRGVRGGGDWIAEAGASALASASSQLRLTPASLIEAAGVEESEEGSKGRTSLPTAATPSAGWLIPQDWPPAEAPTSSRLTGILRPSSDSRNATFGRGPRRSSRGSSCWAPERAQVPSRGNTEVSRTSSAEKVSISSQVRFLPGASPSRTKAVDPAACA